jgi:DNA invertase Pin-like site-specific DNA recombinase
MLEEAVSYRRVSSKRQGRSGLGLAAQKRLIRAYCQFNNIKLVKDYLDIKSGESADRPNVLKAIRYCLQHNILLIVATQSRLARSVLFIANMIIKGPRFISVDNPTATDFQKYIQAAFDENFLRESGKNTKQSLQSAVAKGIKLGTNVFKLKRTLKRKRKTFYKYIRPILREILKQFYTYRAITAELNRRRVRKKRGERGGWKVSEVFGIIQELSLRK